MEKYKIIGRKPNGDIILESNNGSVEVIDEGRFSDLYTKTKNAVLNFVKKGGRILVKIGDVIAENVINIFDVLDPPAGTFIIDITLDIYDCDEDDKEYNHGYYQLVQIIKSSSWYSYNDTIFLDISS